MEHAEAVKLNTVERYLLGELTAAERDAFEEHYFECTDCAGDVKAAAAFIDNVRESMRRAPEAGAIIVERNKPRAWFGWLRPRYALAAVAALVLAVGYQNLVTIPRMKHDLRAAVAQALPTLSLTASGTRGEAKVAEIVIPPNSPFGIFVDIPANDRFVSYSCSIRDKDGKTQDEINVSTAQARETVELFIPGGRFDSGAYEVVIVGNTTTREMGGGEEIARYPFAVQNIR